VDDLANQILTGSTVEGVTFVGGEPFDQAAALAALGSKLRKGGLSVVTFTGNHLEDIVSLQREDWLALLAVSDILIDGPYRQDLPDLSRPWVGSSNQRYHFLSDRYSNLSARLCTLPNRVEIRLTPDGQILINGMAKISHLLELFDESRQI
jgi:anaerobic ribonucleoside-triphosphate reductase activating protein